jgi:hypothetical protein
MIIPSSSALTIFRSSSGNYDTTKELGLRCKQKRKFKATTNSRHAFPVAENLLNQTFAPTRPNEAWVSDITYVMTDEGWLYPAGVKDVFTCELKDQNMENKMKNSLFRALAMATASANAGNWSAAAVPTKVEIVNGAGFMVSGAFGNALGCTSPNLLFMKIDHPQYRQMYATVLRAISTGTKIYGYAHFCQPVGWYSGAETTCNVVTADDTLAIGN